MFGINIRIEDEAVNLEQTENLYVLEKFVLDHGKKEYSVAFLRKYLKKELGVGDVRVFEKDILDSSFTDEELEEKYEWLHGLRD